MKFVLSAIGSRGDVHPMLALAKGLRAAGHQVTLVAAPTFAERAAQEDVPFVGAGRDIQGWINEQLKKGLGTVKVFRAFTEVWRDDLAATVDVLADVIGRDTDHVVCAGADAAGPQVALARGCASSFVFYAPLLFPSREYPPMFIPWEGLPQPLNVGLWHLSDVLLRRLWLPLINPHRVRLGAPPARAVFEVLPERGLFAFDERLYGTASDLDEVLAKNPHMTRPDRVGALVLDNAVEDIDPALVAFLDAGPAPIYVGFGSMADVTPARTLAMLEHIAARTGWRFVLAQGWSEKTVHSDRDDVFVIEGAPHERLFPRCAAVVHHGGAGTTHAALFAGKPMVIVAHGVDQGFWGRRVHTLGIGGPPLKKNKLRAQALEKSLRVALACADEAARVGGPPAQSGVARAVEVLTR